MCNALGVVAGLFLGLAGLMWRLSFTLILLRLRREASGDPVIGVPRRLKPEELGALDVRVEARTLRDVWELWYPTHSAEISGMDGARRATAKTKRRAAVRKATVKNKNGGLQ